MSYLINPYIYQSIPLTRNGLVMYLDAANSLSYPGSGSKWNDLSGNDNNATFVGSPGFSSANGGQITLNGTTQYATVLRSSSISPTSAMTQESWFKLTTDGSYVFLALQYGSSSDNSFAIWREGGAWRGGTRTSSFTWVSITQTLLTNTWYQLVHTFESPIQRLYLNGSEIGNLSQLGTITYDASNTEITISADNNGSGYNSGKGAFVNGSMSIVAMYNRALTATEVSDNFKSVRDRYGI